MLSERRDPRPLAITAVLLATAVWLVTAWTSEARAAPPANDARATAQDLGRLPADVRGTTVDAAVDPDEPGTCSATKNSVWYGFTPGIDREVLVALDAAGDLDASIDVYVRQRSQTTPVVCGRTNRRGEATLELDAAAGTSYLIRIAALANSVTDAFRLRVVAPDRPAQPPGQRLAVGGVAADVERLADPDDSWAVRLKAGRTYRVNLVTRGTGCAVLELYPADIGDFSEQSALRTLRCDAHTVFTAPASGRYSLLVRAPRASRALLHYRLRVGRAKSDDTAPGHALANDVRKHGTLQGSELDAVDLYRFSVARRSDLELRLGTGRRFNVQLLTDGGHRLACGCGGAGDKEIDRRVPAGRYFVAVRSVDGEDGRYTLSRLTRTITRSQMLVEGAASATVAPGTSVSLTLAVFPAVDGRATMLVERFDPLAGWLFDAQFRPAVAGGRGTVAFHPRSVGRWRVTGSFEETRRASASSGGSARFRVAEPLTE